MVWRKGYDLTLAIYRITGTFPRHELYGLSAQMRRAAVSIISNIAEGHDREHRKKYLHFLSLARGSAAELQTQLLLSHDLGYGAKSESEQMLTDLDEIQRMLFAMIHKLSNRKLP